MISSSRWTSKRHSGIAVTANDLSDVVLGFPWIRSDTSPTRTKRANRRPRATHGLPGPPMRRVGTGRSHGRHGHPTPVRRGAHRPFQAVTAAPRDRRSFTLLRHRGDVAGMRRLADLRGGDIERELVQVLAHRGDLQELLSGGTCRRNAARPDLDGVRAPWRPPRARSPHPVPLVGRRQARGRTRRPGRPGPAHPARHPPSVGRRPTRGRTGPTSCCGGTTCSTAASRCSGTPRILLTCRRPSRSGSRPSRRHRDHRWLARREPRFGIAHQTRHWRMGIAADPGRAVDLGEYAVAAVPRHHPDPVGFTHNFTQE
jgi:hypothetical protein